MLMYIPAVNERFTQGWQSFKAMFSRRSV